MRNDKKEKIIEIATKIFSRFGMKKSTMDEIAQHIRMGKSTLYHYFKSKEDIFLEVVKKEADTFKTYLRDELKQAHTPDEKFRVYAKGRMKYLQELVNYYTTLTDAYLDMYSFAEEVRKDFSNFELNTIKQIFNEGIDKGVFAIDNVELTARMVTLAFKGFEYMLITKEWDLDTEQEHDFEEHLDTLIDTFFKGIKK
ncbi:MAG: TetR/AcrR family transcriptional regulator [Spirochaetota bacterium]|nr:MAG: TetR/AcrR family transcriptional regulator [Spirochaetota bacterium]